LYFLTGCATAGAAMTCRQALTSNRPPKPATLREEEHDFMKRVHLHQVGASHALFSRTMALWACLISMLAVGWLGCGGNVQHEKPHAVAAPRVADDHQLIAVPPPPFSEDVFPCSDCHEGEEVNRARRVIEDHEDVVFDHDSENRWCLDCHDADNRDKLRLASGALLDFTESYQLCGQCHGPKLRDWKAGAHGRRTGSWSGIKQYLLCVHCHNPHSPHFEPIKPLPSPTRPEDL
jgi:hypothetical protein